MAKTVWLPEGAASDAASKREANERARYEQLGAPAPYHGQVRLENCGYAEDLTELYGLTILFPASQPIFLHSGSDTRRESTQVGPGAGLPRAHP